MCHNLKGDKRVVIDSSPGEISHCDCLAFGIAEGVILVQQRPLRRENVFNSSLELAPKWLGRAVTRLLG